MRMWMVDPKIMCTQHLLGEHKEIHMFISVIRRGGNVTGFIENNELDVGQLCCRHEELVQEFKRRRFNHNSDLAVWDITWIVDHNPFTKDLKHKRINISESRSLLLTRCKKCYKLATELKPEVLE